MGKSGRIHPSQGKSGWLLEDAKQMEERLAELRLHMEKEHRERQRRLDAGRVWASSDAPRPSVSKRQIAGRGNITLESSLRQGGVNRVMALGSQTQGRGSLSQLSHIAEGSVSRGQEGSRACQRRPETPKRRHETLNQDASSLADGSFDEDESRQSFLAALDAWRGEIRNSHGIRPVDTSSATDSPPFGAHGPKAANGTGISVFRRLVLLRAMEKAGDAAAVECQCCNSKTTAPHNGAPTVAHSATQSAGLERSLSCGMSEAFRSCGTEPVTCSQECAMVTTINKTPCADVLRDEDIIIISVMDVDPRQALTAGTRLPDTIIFSR